MTNAEPSPRRSRRFGEWIGGGVILLSLLIAVECLPLSWKLSLTPNYANEVLPWRIQNREREEALGLIHHLESLIEETPADEDWMDSERLGWVHRIHVEAELKGEKRAFANTYSLSDALPPSYLWFVFQSLSPFPESP